MIQKPYSKVALVDIIQIINVKCNLIINNLCGRSLWINFKIISLMVKIHIHYCGLKIKKNRKTSISLAYYEILGLHNTRGNLL